MISFPMKKRLYQEDLNCTLEELKCKIKNLPFLTSQILNFYFGINTTKPLKDKTIAKYLNISVHEVNRLKEEGLVKLRNIIPPFDNKAKAEYEVEKFLNMIKNLDIISIVDIESLQETLSFYIDKNEIRELITKVYEIIENSNKEIDDDRFSRRLQKELIKKYQDDNDQEALSKLIELNKGFISKYVNKYIKDKEDFEDVFQEAVIGFIESLQNYDLNLGYSLMTYSGYYVVAYIKQYITNQGHAFKIPNKIRDDINKYQDIKTEFQQQHGQKPTEQEIREEMNISQKELQNIQTVSIPVKSLDYVPDNKDDLNIQNIIADETAVTEEIAENDFLKKDIDQAILTLKEEEAYVLIHTFGLYNEEIFTPKEFCEKLRISRYILNKILKNTLKYLKETRHSLKNYLLADENVADNKQIDKYKNFLERTNNNSLESLKLIRNYPILFDLFKKGRLINIYTLLNEDISNIDLYLFLNPQFYNKLYINPETKKINLQYLNLDNIQSFFSYLDQLQNISFNSYNFNKTFNISIYKIILSYVNINLSKEIIDFALVNQSKEAIDLFQKCWGASNFKESNNFKVLSKEDLKELNKYLFLIQNNLKEIYIKAKNKDDIEELKALYLELIHFNKIRERYTIYEYIQKEIKEYDISEEIISYILINCDYEKQNKLKKIWGEKYEKSIYRIEGSPQECNQIKVLISNIRKKLRSIYAKAKNKEDIDELKSLYNLNPFHFKDKYTIYEYIQKEIQEYNISKEIITYVLANCTELQQQKLKKIWGEKYEKSIYRIEGSPQECNQIKVLISNIRKKLRSIYAKAKNKEDIDELKSLYNLNPFHFKDKYTIYEYIQKEIQEYNISKEIITYVLANCTELQQQKLKKIWGEKYEKSIYRIEGSPQECNQVNVLISNIRKELKSIYAKAKNKEDIDELKALHCELYNKSIKKELNIYDFCPQYDKTYIKYMISISKDSVKNFFLSYFKEDYESKIDLDNLPKEEKRRLLSCINNFKTALKNKRSIYVQNFANIINYFQNIIKYYQISPLIIQYIMNFQADYDMNTFVRIMQIAGRNEIIKSRYEQIILDKIKRDLESIYQKAKNPNDLEELKKLYKESYIDNNIINKVGFITLSQTKLTKEILLNSPNALILKQYLPEKKVYATLLSKKKIVGKKIPLETIAKLVGVREEEVCQYILEGLRVWKRHKMIEAEELLKFKDKNNQKYILK